MLRNADLAQELVHALLVSADATPPLVSKTFDVEVPLGTVVNKKISYTNPYNQRKV